MGNRILRLLRWFGILPLWRIVHRCDIIILMIHGVMDEGTKTEWVPLRHRLSRKQLGMALEVLSRFYHFIPLEDAVAMLNGQKPILPHSLVFTFDDGYRNVVKYALPLLHQYKVTPTIFLAAGHCENRQPFWFDRLDYALQHVGVNGREFTIGNEKIQIVSNNRTSLRNSYKRLRDTAKKVMRSDMEMIGEMDAIASKLESESGRRLVDIFERDDWSSVLSWDEIRRVAKEGVSFGSHTVDHIRLGLVDEDVIRDQLSRSKEMIEMCTGMTVDHFCYPSGSFTRQAMRMARDVGYEAAVTTVEGLNRRGDDLMALRRINLPDTGNKAKLLMDAAGLLGLKQLLKVRGAAVPREQFFGD
jgi:peptidoglycan/xylan/chitin deacetylase (PgdA/CDA1 family)